MAMTLDATLKDLGRESPVAFLTAFDQPPALPVRLLNVDLATVTALADQILGLGDPLTEIVQLDLQSSAAAWKLPMSWRITPCSTPTTTCPCIRS
jgi:hypothetical protein